MTVSVIISRIAFSLKKEAPGIDPDMSSTTFSQKLGAIGLVGNVGLIAGIFYKKHEYDMEETRARILWQRNLNDDDLSCYFAAQRYYEQCKFELDDSEIEDCLILSKELTACKEMVGKSIPQGAPSMQPLPRAFRATT